MNNVSYKLIGVLLSIGLVTAACSKQAESDMDAADSTAAAPATPGTEASASQTEEFMERPPSARLPGDAADGSEIDAQSQQVFTELDKDDNGLLSVEETATQEQLTQSWQALDSDADNHLDAIEFSKFEALDEGKAPEEGAEDAASATDSSQAEQK